MNSVVSDIVLLESGCVGAWGRGQNKNKTTTTTLLLVTDLTFIPVKLNCHVSISKNRSY